MEREERDSERAGVAWSVKGVAQGVKSVTRSVHWRALSLHGENASYSQNLNSQGFYYYYCVLSAAR